MRRRAFTLIELMVVVAIISIVAALLIPAVLSRATKAKRQALARQEKRAERAPSASRAAPPGVPPAFEKAALEIDLTASQHRIGMEAYTRYEAAFRCAFVLLRPADTKQPTRLDFRFPNRTTEARDVSLRFGGKEAEGAVYHHGGILWSGKLPAERVAAEVTFVALGRERFEYRLPAANRIGSVSVTLRVEGAGVSQSIPDHALQPTARSAGKLSWRFSNLVSDRPIVLELPGASSPVGRVMLLFKLVGVSVLLFGAGFWYLSELYEPGRMDSFRLGHFLLLALTYSLFFVCFAVLGFRGDIGTRTAMVVSAAVSLPLLVLHVASILDLRFSLAHALPLAVISTGLVINGVYGGPVRDRVFVGAAVLFVAFLTLTHRRWAAGRDRRREELEAAADAQMARLEAQIAQVGELTRAAGRSQSAEVDELLEDHRYLVSRHARMGGERGFERTDTRHHVERQSAALLSRAERVIQNLGSAAPAPPPADDDGVRCLACGESGPRTPFCAQCGTAHPLPLVCGGCGQTLLLPVHLLAEGAREQPLHCPACGQRHHAAT